MKRKTIILLLVCVSILATGCKLAVKRTKVERQYEAGNFVLPLRVMSSIMIGMKSDTNIFEKQDVSFDLYYGLYNNEYIDGDYEFAKGGYLSNDEKDIFVGIYLCEEEHAGEVWIPKEIDSYEDISNYTLLKSLVEEEAFGGGYGYDLQNGRVIIYEHKECFTIPEKFFTEEEGKLFLSVMVMSKKIDKDIYTISGIGELKINYQLTEDGKITITNLEK